MFTKRCPTALRSSSMPGALGVRLARESHQGIEAQLVVNAAGNGSALFYPQVWPTGAHCVLPVLYIVMNNLEYLTLIQGLAAVVAVYVKAPGYEWQPVTNEPGYLKIKGPDCDFLELARSFGVKDASASRSPPG